MFGCRATASIIARRHDSNSRIRPPAFILVCRQDLGTDRHLQRQPLRSAGDFHSLGIARHQWKTDRPYAVEKRIARLDAEAVSEGTGEGTEGVGQVAWLRSAGG